MPSSHVHSRHHGPDKLTPAEEASISETVSALAAPSRVALLFALREGERSVGELARTAGMTASATSQQLRVLRHLRLVVTRRAGRHVLYRLHDDHVAALLEEVRHHAEHAHRGWTGSEPRPARAAAP